MGRSLNRDRREAKMEFNPGQKAALLATSPHRRHRIYAHKLAKVGELLQKNLADSQQDNLAAAESTEA
jgi:hypothetical protein